MFNYSGDPRSSPLDYVRFEVQDTDPEAPLLQDGEILFCVQIEAPAPSPSQKELLGAAAHACEALSRRFAKQPETRIGSLETQWSKAAEAFSERAKELRRRAAGMGLVHFVRTESEKQAKLENPDLVQPLFRRDQFTSPYRGDFSGPGTTSAERTI